MSSGRGISVIIPTYNDARYIEDAVRSVYAQKTALPFEVIVIDDGSTDPESLRAIDDVQNQYPDLIVIRHEHNKGAAVARNSGIEAARFSHILPLDVDVRISTNLALRRHGGYMDRAVSLLESDPDTVLVYSRKNQFGAVRSPYSRHVAPYSERDIVSWNMIGPFTVYRREDVLAIGGYNDYLRNWQDWDIVVALINRRIADGRPAKVHQFEEPYLEYRIRGDGTNITSNPTVKHADVLRAMIARSPEIYARHFPDMTGEKLIEHMIRRWRQYYASADRRLVFECVAHPIDSYKGGKLTHCVDVVMGRLAREWRAITRRSPPPANPPAPVATPGL